MSACDRASSASRRSRRQRCTAAERSVARSHSQTRPRPRTVRTVCCCRVVHTQLYISSSAPRHQCTEEQLAFVSSRSSSRAGVLYVLCAVCENFLCRRIESRTRVLPVFLTFSFVSFELLLPSVVCFFYTRKTSRSSSKRVY